MSGTRRGAYVFLFVCLAGLEGCYYVQAAQGQFDLMRRRRPIEEVIADASSPELLRQRLLMVSEARHFAVDELLLPDNDSYRSYADLERDYVVWNVVAAPEFSLDPKLWCYPIAGCVAYRGYFSEARAGKLAKNLAAQGFDVLVGGVTAYSTLGRFDDPVLNTMMQWNDTDLVSTLFHELAHQKLYIKDDTGFNESFASAVAEVGLRRWLSLRGEPEKLEEHNERRADRTALLQLIDTARGQLEELYASGLDEETMRARKQQIFHALARDLDRYETKLNGWRDGSLNNARIALLGLYEGRVDAFKVLLNDCADDLACFYARAGDLAEMESAEREAELGRLAARRDPGG
ncbi:MAG TPA: aminopeptidase [Woeseiaceae bacterium]|nr:aminopeptidase [Woeseiaceae bacterium]